MEETSIHFRISKTERNKFNSIIALLGLNNKEVFTSFVQKFIKEPKQTLNFLKKKD